MKSLANQNLLELGGPWSILSRQKRDHVRLDALLARLDKVAAKQQQPVLREIYRLVFPHAFAEESVLWPVLRRVLPDGQELTLEVELEHQAINELVTRLESLDPCSVEWRTSVERIVELLRQDVRDEEDELLPRLQTKLTASQVRRLGMVWEVVRRIAPTRAHPIVSRRPPGNMLAALPLTLLDRSRDRVDTLLHRGAGAATQPLQALSSALTLASHAVERLPGLRRGEDPATQIRREPHIGWGAAVIITLVTASAVIALAHRKQQGPIIDHFPHGHLQS